LRHGEREKTEVSLGIFTKNFFFFRTEMGHFAETFFKFFFVCNFEEKNEDLKF